MSATSTVEQIQNPKQGQVACAAKDELRMWKPFSTTAALGKDWMFGYFVLTSSKYVVFIFCSRLFLFFGKTPPMFWICARLAGAAVGNAKRKC